MGQGRVPPPKKSGKIFFWQLLCKIQTFFGKKSQKFGHFDNFFIHIFRAKMSLPLMLTELLRLCFTSLLKFTYLNG